MTRRTTAPAPLSRLVRMVVVLAAVAAACLGMQRMLSLPVGAASPGHLTRAQAQAGTVRILPASATVDVEDTVTVELWLEDAADYYGLDVRIAFDPHVVTATRPTLLWDLFDDDNHFVIRNQVDNDEGEVWYAVTNRNPAEPFTGTGRICAVTFSGVVSGTTPLEIYYAKGATRTGEGLFPTQVDGEITVVTPTPLPSITALDPSAVPVGSPPFTLTVSGANFIADSVVLWDGEPRPTTYVATTTLTADIAAAEVAAAGTVEVQVANSPDPVDRSNPVTFAILNPAPQLTSISPVSRTVGAPAFTLTVRGANFVAGSTVHWGGQPRPTTVVSATEVTAHIAAADLAAPGNVAVTVVNPAPGGGPSNEIPFTVAPAEPGPDAHAIYLPLLMSGRP